MIGSTVHRETYVKKVGGVTQDTYEIRYLIDSDESIIGFVYENETYYYLKDHQGNIISIIDESGNELVQYEYDAFGNVINDPNDLNGDIYEINPYTYRSYRVDSETSWYYLNSRYYNPEVSRFLNADGMLGQVGDVQSTNAYAYAANNPIIFVDEDGRFWNLIAGFVVGGLISAAVSIATQLIFTGEVDAAQTGIAFLSGGVSGLLVASGIGLVGSVILNSALGGVTDVASQLAEGVEFSELNPVTIITSTVISGVGAYFGGAGLKNVNNPLAQLKINLSMLKSMNSANPSMLFADMITDLLATASSVAAKEVGKASVVAFVTGAFKDLVNGAYKMIFD